MFESLCFRKNTTINQCQKYRLIVEDKNWTKKVTKEHLQMLMIPTIQIMMLAVNQEKMVNILKLDIGCYVSQVVRKHLIIYRWNIWLPYAKRVKDSSISNIFISEILGTLLIINWDFVHLQDRLFSFRRKFEISIQLHLKLVNLTSSFNDTDNLVWYNYLLNYVWPNKTQIKRLVKHKKLHFLLDFLKYIFYLWQLLITSFFNFDEPTYGDST